MYTYDRDESDILHPNIAEFKCLIESPGVFSSVYECLVMIAHLFHQSKVAGTLISQQTIYFLECIDRLFCCLTNFLTLSSESILDSRVSESLGPQPVLQFSVLFLKEMFQFSVGLGMSGNDEREIEIEEMPDLFSDGAFDRQSLVDSVDQVIVSSLSFVGSLVRSANIERISTETSSESLSQLALILCQGTCASQPEVVATSLEVISALGIKDTEYESIRGRSGFIVPARLNAVLSNSLFRRLDYYMIQKPTSQHIVFLDKIFTAIIDLHSSDCEEFLQILSRLDGLKKLEVSFQAVSSFIPTLESEWGNSEQLESIKESVANVGLFLSYKDSFLRGFN